MTTPVLTRRTFHRLTAGSLAVAGLRQLCPAADAENGSFAFGVITDAQYCDADPTGSRHYRRSLDKLAACVEELNQHDLAFVIHLGDFIDRDFSSFDKIMSIYKRLKSPCYHALGNHDFSVETDLKDRVPAKLGMDSRYYAMQFHGWRFLVLDGNDLSVIARRPGEEEHARAQEMLAELKAAKSANAQTWNGGVGEKQLQWLDTQLGQADRAGERAVVFCHFPVYPSNVHNLWNDAEVVQVLESHSSVVAYMNGHNHAGLYAEKSGIHYVTFRGMVETAETSAYAVVQVEKKRLRIMGRGRTASRDLSLR